MYYIYKHENKLNHKTYIGCSTNPVKRWRNGFGYQSNKPFFKDIVTFGWNNFNHQILLEIEDPKFASIMEEQLIKTYGAEYNISPASNASIRSLNTKHSVPVIQFSKEGELIAEFPSTSEAERQTGIPYTNISATCSGKRHSAGGFKWQYKK